MDWSLAEIQSYAVVALFLALFQSSTANKIDLERTRDYKKFFLVCKVEILQVMVNKIESLIIFLG